ncbi:hypothetical protein BHM03_00060141 [Ensete ventricosum]|nr:hypothetical protein BHM03_00060141 [Ensete ventricosum]
MSVLLMEAAVSSLVLSLGARLDQIGRPEKPLLSDLEENLLRASLGSYRTVLDDSEVFERRVSIRCCRAPYSTVVFV